jgi:hypothetical protein
MGFFDSLAQGFNDLFLEPEITNGVEGTAQVVSASGYHGGALYQNCTLDLVVEAPGIAATATKITCLVHYNHWPVVGGTLPVLIERDNPTEVIVQWEKVPDATVQAMNEAERIAAARRAGGKTYMPGTTVKIVGDPSSITPEQKEKLLALGIDIDKLTAG